jgi:hypothetical protein
MLAAAKFLVWTYAYLPFRRRTFAPRPDTSGAGLFPASRCNLIVAGAGFFASRGAEHLELIEGLMFMRAHFPAGARVFRLARGLLRGAIGGPSIREYGPE